MAYGVPVIITPYCGIRTLVEEGHAGLVVVPEKRPLAEALHRIVHDEILRSGLKEGCRAVAEKLSWDRLAEQMEKYYDEAMVAKNGSH